MIGGVGTEKVVTIKDIDYLECYDEATKKKIQKQSLIFEDSKPLVLNKTNSKQLKKLFSPNEDKPENCVGHKIILRVESVKAFGKTVDAVRIREFSEIKCEECGELILPASGKTVDQLVEISKRNTNKVLCVACMRRFKEDKTHE